MIIYARDARVVGNFATRPINLETQNVLAAVEKMANIGPSMKTDQVCAQHPFQQFSPPRKNAENLFRWPRNMPKEADWQMLAALAQHLWYEGEMKILHPRDVV